MKNLTEHEQDLSLAAKLEALLFIAPEPVTIKQLSDILETSIEDINAGLKDLEIRYIEGGHHGIRLQKNKDRYQLTSAPQASGIIERFLGLEVTTYLTRPALEALAIVVYRQPVTRPQIDAIRGVNSDGVIRTLLSKGLIHEVGRAEAPGRPILYSTTAEFLQYFGLNSLEELPALDD